MKQQDYSTLNRNKEAQNENKTKNTNLNEDTSPTNFRDTLDSPQKQYTPMERLAKCKVSTETKNILIGDSVLTKINPKSCFDDPKKELKASSAGLIYTFHPLFHRHK